MANSDMGERIMYFPPFWNKVYIRHSNREISQESIIPTGWRWTNWPFPSCLLPQFQNDSTCETIEMKMTDLHENGREGGTHFHMNGFARRLVLKQRLRR